MLIVSIWTALLGVTEPFFVPLYWAPPSLFDLALRTGFDIESFLFSFGIGGIAVVLYGMFFRNRCAPVSANERHRSRHRYHWWAIVSSPVIFIVLFFATALNPIYSAIIAMTVGGVAALRCRPDLKKKMATSALLFLGLYFVYFQVLIILSPGYVERVWNMEALSGVLIAGIPLEELLFAVSFGFFWSSIYEHIAWKKLN
ncbi:TPA: hypothetical protein DIV48_03115 [Candidatus Kaiserbacteria bacterium]|nr:hypothetical protein [Candidatus Kaiserbacteria bacterium]